MEKEMYHWVDGKVIGLPSSTIISDVYTEHLKDFALESAALKLVLD